MIKICVQCNKEFECNTDRILCRSCIQKNCADKKRETFMKKYGVDNPSKSKEIQDKMTETFMKKYGVKRPIQLPEIQKKMKDTIKSRYGVEYFCQHSDFLSKSTTRISKIQKEFEETLNDFGLKTSLEFPIEGKSFDIVIESKNLVVEVDPSYTHSITSNHWGKGISNTYHLEKTLIAERNGYRCIHVFDWDDKDKIAKLISSNSRIPARKCKVNCDSKEETKEKLQHFVDENSLYHIDVTSHQSIWLIYEEKIVAALLLHKKSNDLVYELEYVPKLNLQVVGGLSKLWFHANKQFNINQAFVICDRSKFTGNAFQDILGFELICNIQPEEIWSKDNITNDEPEDVKNLLETGFIPVCNCGYSILSNSPNLDISSLYLHNIEENKIDYDQILKQIQENKTKTTKYCRFCGKPFHPSCGTQKYCGKEHKRICPVCKRVYVETNNDNLKRPPIACSYECRFKRTAQTSLRKYGCKAPGNNPQARKKASETMMKHLGVPYAMMSDEIRAKSKNNIHNKYGAESVNSSVKIDYSDIKTIIYEDNKYLVFESQDSYLLENQYIEEYVYSMNKIPVVVYKDEDIKKVMGQIPLPNNIVVDSKDLELYKLNKQTVQEFIEENDYIDKVEGVILALGLVSFNTVYQVMLFGRNKHNKNYKLQLLRICNKQGHTILGGLDKQSSSASTQFGIDSCIAYQDQAKPFMNDYYESIGMKFVRKNPSKKITRGNQTIYDCGTNVYAFE